MSIDIKEPIVIDNVKNQYKNELSEKPESNIEKKSENDQFINKVLLK